MQIRKRLAAPLIVCGLAFSGLAAAAVPGGTYSGTSHFSLDGTLATHPFSLRVQRGAIVRVAFVATGNCGALDASGGLNVRIPITKNAFDSTISFSVDTIKLIGTFKHATVSGTMSGRIDESAENKKCVVIPARFSATRA